jgi:hypothetical protein
MLVSALFSQVASYADFFGSLETAADYHDEGPLRWIVQHPGQMFFAILGLYIVWLPFSAISWIVQELFTGWIAFLILILLIVIIGRLVATSIIFPISVSMVAKSMQKEVASKVRSKVDRCLSVLEKFCFTLSVPNVVISPDVMNAIEALRHPLLNVWIAQQKTQETSDIPDTKLAHLSILRHYIQTAIALMESLQGTAMASTNNASSSIINDESLQNLASCDPMSLPLHPHPPFISLVSTDSVITNCVSSGLFTVLEKRQLALACLSRARWLSIWIEVIPYSTGLGGESAAREIANSLKLSKSVLTQAKSMLWKSCREAAIDHFKNALLCRRKTGFTDNRKSACKDSTGENGLSIADGAAQCFGIPSVVIEEVKSLLARDSKTELSSTDFVSDAASTCENSEKSSGNVCEGCGKVHEGGERGEGVDHENGHMHSGDTLSSLPPSNRLEIVKHVVKQARKVISSILDTIWKFSTSRFIPEPVCGLSYFRGEAELANGRQVWIPTEEDGMWVDAMYFLSLVPNVGHVKERRIRSGRYKTPSDESSLSGSGDSSSSNVGFTSTALPGWVSDCYSGVNSINESASGAGRRRRGGRGASNADEISVIDNESIHDDLSRETGINVAPLRIPLIHTTTAGRISFPSICTRYFCLFSQMWSFLCTFLCSSKALQPCNLTETMIASQIEFSSKLGGAGNTAPIASPRGVVLICGPNAGLYEYSWRFSEWVDKYRRMGFDVVVFNYRGYGRTCRRVEVNLLGGFFKFESTDITPRPISLQRDAQAVATWILRETRANALIIHGESLGGIAACHLGKLGLCDFLIADRTFDTLTSAGRHMVGAWSEPALIALTGWTGSNAINFVRFVLKLQTEFSETLSTTISSSTTSTISSTTSPLAQEKPSGSTSSLTMFKVLAQDFDDQVIHHEASLALGVAAVIASNSSPDRVRIKGELDVCAAQLYLLLLRSMRESAHLFTLKVDANSIDSVSPLLRLRMREASKVTSISNSSENVHSSLSTSSRPFAYSAEHLMFLKTLKRRGLETPMDSLSFQESILLLYKARPKSEYISAAVSSHEASSLCALAERKVEQSHGDRLLDGLLAEQGSQTANSSSAFSNSLLEASTRIVKKCIEYDSEMFVQGCERLRLPGTVSIVIAGLSNGLGLRLGDVVSSAAVGERGVESVKAFLASAMLWGWPLQERKGSLYTLRCRAASRISASIKHARKDGGGGGEIMREHESLVNPNSLAWVFGLKSMPYLHSAAECSLVTTKRRLEAMLRSLQSRQDTASHVIERPESDSDAVQANSSEEIIREMLDVLGRVEKLRVELEKIITENEKQICLPLAVGHNSPWTIADLAILETLLEEF